MGSCSDRAHYADVSAPMVVLSGVPMRSCYGPTKPRAVYLAPVNPDAFFEEIQARKAAWDASLAGSSAPLPRSPRWGHRSHARNAIVPAHPVAQPVQREEDNRGGRRSGGGGRSDGGRRRQPPPPPFAEQSAPPPPY